MSEPERQALADRQVDLLLREMHGVESPPDVLETVRRAVATQPRAVEEHTHAPRRTPPWLVAALVLVGLATLGMVLWQSRAPAPDAPTDQDPPRIPSPVQISAPARFDSLPDDVTSLRCLGYGDDELLGLARLRGLRYLEFVPAMRGREMKRISDVGLEHLRGLSKLEVLRLSQSAVRGVGLRALVDLPVLRSLDLRRCLQLEADGLDVLARLRGLRALDISENRFSCTPAVLRQVCKLVQLQRLDLSGNTLLGKTQLRELGVLTQLRELSLNGMVGMHEAHVGGMKVATRTGDGVGVDDALLSVLAQRLPKLHTLRLAGCRDLSAEGLAPLLARPGFVGLDLRDCTKLPVADLWRIVDRGRWQLLGLSKPEGTTLVEFAAQLRARAANLVDLEVLQLGPSAGESILVDTPTWQAVTMGKAASEAMSLLQLDSLRVLVLHAPRPTQLQRRPEFFHRKSGRSEVYVGGQLGGSFGLLPHPGDISQVEYVPELRPWRRH